MSKKQSDPEILEYLKHSIEKMPRENVYELLNNLVSEWPEHIVSNGRYKTASDNFDTKLFNLDNLDDLDDPNERNFAQKID